MKLIIIFLAVSFLFSCNSKDAEKKITKNNLDIVTSVTKDSIKINPKPVSKPLLIARGSEPGWYAEFYPNHLRLLINNGTDSLHLDHNFSDIALKESYKKTIVQANSTDGVGSSMTMVIKIDSQQCSEVSGSVREKSISLRYNNQNFKGCAYSDVK